MGNSCSPINHVDSTSLQLAPPSLQPHSQSVPVGVRSAAVDQRGNGPPPQTPWKSLHPDFDDDNDDMDDPDGMTALAGLHSASMVDGLQPTAFQQLVKSFGSGSGGSSVGCHLDSLGADAGLTSSTTGETDDDTIVSFDEPMSSSGAYHRRQLSVGGGTCLQEVELSPRRVATTPFRRYQHQHQDHRVLNIPT